ncbi:MAG: response regulator transcription factor [Spirochaetales bacterium]|nr:response regulator transcription factor [Spirochaetales bacterium]
MKNETVLIGTRQILPAEVFAHFITEERLGKPAMIVRDGRAALRKIIDLRPCLIILDAFLPVLSTIAILEELHKRNLYPPVICFCPEVNKIMAVKLFKSGVRGIIDYQASIEEVNELIRQVKSGKKIIPDAIAQAIEARDFEMNHDKYSEITTRQIEVMHLTGEGCSNSEIAYKLKISEKTVEKHKTKIRDKTGLSSSAEIAVFAITHGFVEVKEETCL